MEITARGDTLSTSGMSGSNEGILNKAAGAVAPTADWLAELGESVTTMQKKLVADLCSYVSANPLKALWSAVVEGFLLSRIILR